MGMSIFALGIGQHCCSPRSQPGRGHTIRRPSSRISSMNKQADTLALIGRILIAVLFLLSGLGKAAAPAATQGYIAAMGLPAPVLAYFGSMTVELVGSVLLIVGFR